MVSVSWVYGFGVVRYTFVKCEMYFCERTVGLMSMPVEWFFAGSSPDQITDASH